MVVRARKRRGSTCTCGGEIRGGLELSVRYGGESRDLDINFQLCFVVNLVGNFWPFRNVA